MDAATLQSKVDSGYGKAARYLGSACDLYRPEDPLYPLQTPLYTGPTAVNAVFTQNLAFSAFNKYGNAVWIGMFDGGDVKAGDYLKGADGTFFVAAKQHLLPYLCVECNRTLQIIRPWQDDVNVGFTGYAAGTERESTLLMQGWPASVLRTTQGAKNGAGLPGDQNMSGWQILMPAFTDLMIITGDIAVDEFSRRYSIGSAELTDLGWRIFASLEGA